MAPEKPRRYGMCGLAEAELRNRARAGRDPVTEHRHVTQTLGYLSQRFSLYGDLSIARTSRSSRRFHGLSMRDPAIRPGASGCSSDAARAFRARLPTSFRRKNQKLALGVSLSSHAPRIIRARQPTKASTRSQRANLVEAALRVSCARPSHLMAHPISMSRAMLASALLHEGQLVALEHARRTYATRFQASS